MDRQALFDHFYDQYKSQLDSADYLYRRAATWLTADVLVATAFATVAGGDSTRWFGVSLREPTAFIIALITGTALAVAFVLIGAAMFPRRYERFSLPHEIEIFRKAYRNELERLAYPPEHRDSAEQSAVLDGLSETLASKTQKNAELNEHRHRMLSWSSVFTMVSVLGLSLLLLGSVVRSLQVATTQNSQSSTGDSNR